MYIASKLTKINTPFQQQPQMFNPREFKKVIFHFVNCPKRTLGREGVGGEGPFWKLGYIKKGYVTTLFKGLCSLIIWPYKLLSYSNPHSHSAQNFKYFWVLKFLLLRLLHTLEKSIDIRDGRFSTTSGLFPSRRSGGI